MLVAAFTVCCLFGARQRSVGGVPRCFVGAFKLSTILRTIGSSGQMLDAETGSDCCREFGNKLQYVIGQTVGWNSGQDDPAIDK